MAVYTETIKLEDQVSPAAKAAAGQTALLEKGLASANAQLVKASAIGDIKGFQKATRDAEALKIAISQIDPALTKEMQAAKLADTANAKMLETSKQASKDAVKAQAEKDKALVKSNALIKQGNAAVSEDMAAQGALLEGLAAGAVAVAAAVAVVVVAIGALIIKGAAFAISASQGKQAMLGMVDALGQGKVTGAEVDDMLSGLADRIGISKDTLLPFTKEYLKLGVTGVDALEKLTTAAISAQAIVGDPSGAAAFQKLQEKILLAAQAGQQLKIPLKGLGSLAEAGLTVDDVAKKMGVSAKTLGDQLKSGAVDAKKFGDALTDAVIEKGAGPLKFLATTVDAIKKKFEQDFGDLFEDIDVKPFMAEVKDLFGIFGQAQPSGQALKAGIGGFFKEVFAIATKVVPLVKHFLLDLVIYGLKAYIALKPIAKAIKEWAESAEGSETITTVLKTMVDIFKVLAVVVGFVVAVVIVFAATLIGIQVAIVAVGLAILNFVGQAGVALTQWVAGAATAAYDFVAGLVNGIANGGAMVSKAVSDLAGKASGAFKSALGINSPSTVMMGMGVNMGEGVVGGVESTEGDVAASTSALAGAAVKGAASAPAPSGGAAKSGGGGAAITFEAGSIVIDGAGKSALEITEEMIALVMQRVALGMGL